MTMLVGNLPMVRCHGPPRHGIDQDGQSPIRAIRNRVSSTRRWIGSKSLRTSVTFERTAANALNVGSCSCAEVALDLRAILLTPDRPTPLAHSCARQTDHGDQVARPGHPPRAQLRASNRSRRPSGPTGPPPSRATARVKPITATKWPDRATPIARNCARQTYHGDQVARPGHLSRATARVNPRTATKWPDRATLRAQLRASTRARRPSGPTGPPRAQLRASNRHGDQVARPGPLARSCARQSGTATKWPDRALAHSCARQLRDPATKWPDRALSRTAARVNPSTATKWPDRALSRTAARINSGIRRPSGPTGPSRAQLRASIRVRRPSGPTGPSRAQLRASTPGRSTKWPDRALSRTAARINSRGRRPSGPTGPSRAQLRASIRAGDQVARPGPLAHSCARQHAGDQVARPGPLAHSCARQPRDRRPSGPTGPSRAQLRASTRDGDQVARPGPLAHSCAHQPRDRRPSGPTGPSRAQLRASTRERRPSGPTGPSRAQLRASTRERRPSGPTGPLLARSCAHQLRDRRPSGPTGPLLAHSCARQPRERRGQVGASADALQAILACARIRPRRSRSAVIARNPAGVALFRARPSGHGKRPEPETGARMT